jgi:hypothetical protein
MKRKKEKNKKTLWTFLFLLLKLEKGREGWIVKWASFVWFSLGRYIYIGRRVSKCLPWPRRVVRDSLHGRSSTGRRPLRWPQMSNCCSWCCRRTKSVFRERQTDKDKTDTVKNKTRERESDSGEDKRDTSRFKDVKGFSAEGGLFLCEAGAGAPLFIFDDRTICHALCEIWRPPAFLGLGSSSFPFLSSALFSCWGAISWPHPHNKRERTKKKTKIGRNVCWMESKKPWRGSATVPTGRRKKASVLASEMYT